MLELSSKITFGNLGQTWNFVSTKWLIVSTPDVDFSHVTRLNHFKPIARGTVESDQKEIAIPCCIRELQHDTMSRWKPNHDVINSTHLEEWILDESLNVLNLNISQLISSSRTESQQGRHETWWFTVSPPVLTSFHNSRRNLSVTSHNASKSSFNHSWAVTDVIWKVQLTNVLKGPSFWRLKKVCMFGRVPLPSHFLKKKEKKTWKEQRSRFCKEFYMRENVRLG